MRVAQLLPEHCNDAKAVDCAINVFRQYEDNLAAWTHAGPSSSAGSTGAVD